MRSEYFGIIIAKDIVLSMIASTLDFSLFASHTVPAMDKKIRTLKPSHVDLPAPINPRGIQSVYSNNMEVQFSALDARLTFNEIIADHGVVTVERRAHIVMPLQHVVAMMEALGSSMAQLQEMIKKQSELTAKK